MSAEQAADLAALNAEALGQVGAVPDQPGAPVAPDLGQEIGGLATALLAVVSPMFPSLKPVYTPEVVESASAAIANVCKKHGWLAGGVMGEYAEEITALVICGPLAVATMRAVKHDLAKPVEQAGVLSAAVTPAPSDSAPPDNVLVLERG